MGIPALQPPLIQQNKPPAYIAFSAEIVPKTTEVLLATAAKVFNQGHTEIHILLSTPGGSVMHGINAYNVLRGLPCSPPQTTFMLHGVAFGTQRATQFFEKNLAERLASVQANQARIAEIYRDCAGISLEDSERFFLGESTIGAGDALRRGIVHELRDVQISAGGPVLQLVFDRK